METVRSQLGERSSCELSRENGAQERLPASVGLREGSGRALNLLDLVPRVFGVSPPSCFDESDWLAARFLGTSLFQNIVEIVAAAMVNASWAVRCSSSLSPGGGR